MGQIAFHGLLKNSLRYQDRAQRQNIAAAKLTWLRFLLQDIGIPQYVPPVLYCDNLSALHLVVSPLFHIRTKHVEIDYHYVRVQVAVHRLETRHVSSSDQLANIFTKALFHQPFTSILYKLGITAMSSLGEGIESNS